VDDETRTKENLVGAYRQLAEMGLMNQATGNLSCRIADGMLISCSGATAENLTVDGVVKVRNDGSVDGDLKPSSEWQMHQAIYERHEGASAIVHTHSDYCVALATNNQSLPGFHYMVGTFGGPDVPCVPYSTFGSAKLAIDAAEALDDRAACLLGNHGMICRGADLPTAVAHAERLEILCKHYWLARRLGGPDLLTDEEWEEFFDRARKAGYVDSLS